jgi:pimeloyl-ACP methyl ester carboxylesterase
MRCFASAAGDAWVDLHHPNYMDLEGAGVAPRLFLPDQTKSRSLSRPRRATATAHEQSDVTVHGLRLRYIDVRPAEETDAPLLLIHGHSSRLEEYEELLPHLARRRRVLVPDLPGSGYSDKPNRAYDLAFFEDHLLGFLDALDVQHCHLAGGSLGGNLVLRLGQRAPHRFSRLAAWAPACAWDSNYKWALFGRFMKRVRFMFWPCLWLQSRFWFSPAFEKRNQILADAWTYYREVYGPGFHRMYWEIGVDQALNSLFPEAHRIEHPTYLAYGDQDKALGMDRGVQRLAKLIPNVVLRRFDGARHSLASEIPAVLGAEVDSFLASS